MEKNTVLGSETAFIDLDKPFLNIPKLSPEEEIVEVEVKTPDKIMPRDIMTMESALKLTQLRAILNDYEEAVVKDVVQLRNYITNKLLGISHMGSFKEQLRALELLGKISDVGLFSDKSEVTIKRISSDSVEDSLREKLNALLQKAEKDMGTATLVPKGANPDEEIPLEDEE